MQDKSYTTEEIANLLRISKLTVYDLIKKGELPAYRVGRQMRVDAADLEAYKARAKGVYNKQPTIASVSNSVQPAPQENTPSMARNIIISGQDVSLDMLANELEKKVETYRALRSYVGSINSLIAMYRGEADVVSTHLYDGDTEEYNVPYVRRLFSGHSYMMVNMVSRWAGFYVQKGNPHKLRSWDDLKKPGIIMVNREKGSGARTLIEEKLRQHGITGAEITGYDREEKNHLAVAGAVARLEADVGIGIEKAAMMIGVDFIPMIRERYDLVMMKKKENEPLIHAVSEILSSSSFRQALEAIGGYDLTHTGKVMYETP